MPYPDREDDGQDKNKSEEELDAEALTILHKIKRGESRRDVALTLGISQATLVRRLQRAILNPVPKSVQREIEAERLDDLTLRVHEALEAGVATTADLALLLREARALSAARTKLRGLAEVTSSNDPDEDDLNGLPAGLKAAAEEAERRIAEEGRRLRGEAS